MLVFYLQWEIVFDVLHILVLRTYLVYNTVVWLCQFFCCGGKVLLRPEKKSSSRVAGKFYYDRKKKVLVICLAGCAVVSVFGSGEK